MCDIRPCIFSDHDSVDLELELQNVFSHGPGIWRLNLDLLDDENFCIMISGIISKHAQLRETFPSIHEWWDFLKDFVKYTAKKYGRDKQRKLNSEKVTATNCLINAKRSLVNGNTSATKLIDELESQIKSIVLRTKERKSGVGRNSSKKAKNQLAFSFHSSQHVLQKIQLGPFMI